MTTEPPETGFVFHPVGNGDSTTIWINADTAIQLDIHEVEAADGEDDPRSSVVDHLVEHLPETDGLPYLAAFGATHLDNDHIKGFAELAEKVTIGDLWFTPQVVSELDEEELSEDAKAFIAEAKRRIEVLRSDHAAGSGDRIRIFGASEILGEAPYSELPDAAFSLAGEIFTAVDGTDFASEFQAFVLAPESIDEDTASNDTSLGLQVTLIEGDDVASALFLGDLEYATISDIFKRSEEKDVACDVFLAPHHCSKSVMYAKNENGDTELKDDVLEEIAAALNDGGYIVASCSEIPSSSGPGENPPHADARKRYEEIAESGHFLVTGEYPDTDDLSPIVFDFANGELKFDDTRSAQKAADLSAVVEEGRGGASSADAALGFGFEWR